MQKVAAHVALLVKKTLRIRDDDVVLRNVIIRYEVWAKKLQAEGVYDLHVYTRSNIVATWKPVCLPPHHIHAALSSRLQNKKNRVHYLPDCSFISASKL